MLGREISDFFALDRMSISKLCFRKKAVKRKNRPDGDFSSGFSSEHPGPLS
jgi:hypothetical protein